MAKSRAKISRKKRFDNFRNALFWILCCGRRTVREDEDTGKNETPQQHSLADKAAAASEANHTDEASTKKSLHEYPVYLNPFTGDDGGGGDGCGGDPALVGKENGRNTIEEYPEDLNPFSAEEDGQKETEDHEHQININKE